MLKIFKIVYAPIQGLGRNKVLISENEKNIWLKVAERWNIKVKSVYQMNEFGKWIKILEFENE